MEAKARVLQTKDCGALLVDRMRAPYVTGCVLPLDAIRPPHIIPTRLESKIQVHKGTAAVELHAQLEDNGRTHHLQFVLPYAEHREFLLSLSEASALYLLTGTEHPKQSSLHQRVNQGGLAIEVTEAVRSQILLCGRLCDAMLEFRETACGC
jgi:hypothetical protein